jgi:hypothetical protein
MFLHVERIVFANTKTCPFDPTSHFYLPGFPGYRARAPISLNADVDLSEVAGGLEKRTD